MKKRLCILLAALVLLLGGCARTMDDVIAKEPRLYGTVLEVTDSAVLVAVAPGYPAYESCDQVWVSLDVEFSDSMTQFVVGDKVNVYYDGLISESYPGQIDTVYAITLQEAAGSQPQETTVPETTAPPQTTAAPTQPPVPAAVPAAVGIYIPAEDGTRARVLVTEFSSQRKAKTDIDCFEILASTDACVEGGSFMDLWKGLWEAWDGNETGKIGFHIEFSLSDGSIISRQLLKPSDSKEFYDYLEIYMYDDIHQTPGVWYTHLEDSNMKEETVISSIKLTSGSRISEVGDISLTAFIYNGPEHFDTDGNYIGQTSMTVTIRDAS